MEHDEGCWHCQAGCDHPHSYNEPVTTPLFTPCGPGIIGSKLPDGPATLTDFRTGLTIAANSWSLVRCMGCGTEVRVPTDALTPFHVHDDDGMILAYCGACMLDTGHPEYN
jgi:hypothetical protein